MSWTIACFCGNIYTAPPDRCAVCGSTIEDAAPCPTAGATDADALAPHTFTDADRQGISTHGLPGQTAATLTVAMVGVSPPFTEVRSTIQQAR